MGYWNQEWQNLRDDGCICPMVNYDPDNRVNNAACPVHGPKQETGDDMGKPNVDAAAAMFPQHEKYQEEKIAEHGYPGLGPTTSQADVMMKKANEPHMHTGKIAGITTSIARSMYPPHKFVPTQTGLIGAPCQVCGGLPSDPGHMISGKILTPEEVLALSKQPEVMIGSDAGDALVLDIRNIPNDQAMRVCKKVLPELLELFLKKSKDYGADDDVDTLTNLGPKASFVDMSRKMRKLKRALWDGVELEGEGVEEILQDLAGHIFHILDGMRDAG